MQNVKVGDTVVVKPNVSDPDTGHDLGGWRGRVIEIEPGENDEPTLVTIQWDSLALKSIPHEALAYCEREGLNWAQMRLYAEEVELAQARDNQRDVARAIKEIESRVGWLHLGEEGELVQQVLMSVPHDDDWKAMKTWFKHLKRNLVFPFEAEVFEYQERGPIRAGDRLRVLGIMDVDDLYGVLVHVAQKWENFVFPLCDLEVLDRNSPNFAIVYAYAVWFSNR